MAVALPSATLFPSPAARAGSRENDMKALVYLLGARALDIAQERNDVRPIAEEPPGPLATTAETAAAWRGWGRQGAAPRVATEHGRRLLPREILTRLAPG
jgi:hypothetical protein